MTAEIAVMNREAIALAADSAVTMRDETGEKVFPTANKIFTLSKYEPVAAMIYGNAHFLGVPWEPTLKLFRRELGTTRYSTVAKYGEELLKWIKGHRGLFPKDQCDIFCRDHVEAPYGLIRTTYEDRVKAGSAPANALSTIVGAYRGFWRGQKVMPGINKKQAARVKRKYASLIDKSINLIFNGIALTSKLRKMLQEIGFDAILKCPPNVMWPQSAGLVVAGFGEKEYFPSLRAFSLQGIFDGHLHYRMEGETKVGFRMNAAIMPFAQSDMAHTFMEGVDREYQSLIEGDMSSILSQYPDVVIDGCKFLSVSNKLKLKDRFAQAKTQIEKKYRQGLLKFRHEKFIDPVLTLISYLPKSELPLLAESMVNLTSLRRKISMNAETVGGPIDVALISKGDGLIWIKRKHYFDPTLNRQFLRNYNRGAR